MTFKEYLKTPEAKKKIKAILKKKKEALPQCKQSRHMDSSTMIGTANLPAASPEQPAMS